MGEVMLFDDFYAAQTVCLSCIFFLALIMGAVVCKTNFCTMGAISDWVNMGDTGRLKAWFLAVAVSILGMVLFEAFGLVNADVTVPDYRKSQLVWAENLIGGLMFGIGMTLSSGCGSKTLIRIGGGNLKSVCVLMVIAITAFFMSNPIGDDDQTLYTLLFHDWMAPLAIDLSTNQDIGALIAGEEHSITARFLSGMFIVTALLYFIFRSTEFRHDPSNISSGLVVGFTVLGIWYVTSNIRVSVDNEQMGLAEYVQNWDFVSETEKGRPADSRPMDTHSLTIINPASQAFGFTKTGFDRAYLTPGIVAIGGIMLGALLISYLTGRFRIEWFSSWNDFLAHLCGAFLMGTGGILAMGCTMGQAITGVSTLAIGSFIAFTGIFLGCVVTLKIMYLRLQ